MDKRIKAIPTEQGLMVSAKQLQELGYKIYGLSALNAANKPIYDESGQMTDLLLPVDSWESNLDPESKQKEGSGAIQLEEPATIKAYFEKVRNLHKSGEKFPVNLDDVWPLAYSQKVKAIAVLKGNFLEGDDFYLSQMGKVIKIKELRNGVKVDAALSVKCLEYFIARKVRAVFDVYRQVFHQAIDHAENESMSASLIHQQAQISLQHTHMLLAHDRQIRDLEDTVKDLKHQASVFIAEQALSTIGLEVALVSKYFQYDPMAKNFREWTVREVARYLESREIVKISYIELINALARITGNTHHGSGVRAGYWLALR